MSAKVTSSDKVNDLFPETPVRKIITPIERLMKVETTGGIVLIIMTVAALIWANLSPETYHHFWHMPFTLKIGDWIGNGDLHWLINDALMTIFFFNIGLEVKGEMTYGELHNPKAASLPIIAAAGGMLFPALIYLTLCPHGENSAAHGWGIPTATDIAFVVGCMAILGKKVPHALRVMILTLAIADDIGAILVIAIGYPSGDGINFAALGAGFALLVLINVLFRIGVRNLLLHGVIGVAVWAFFVKSGVHPTIAGVLLGLSVPAKAVIANSKMAHFASNVGGVLSGESQDRNAKYEVFTMLKRGASESISMQERLFKPLVPWVNFFIMPLFALSNAGVEIKLGGVEVPVMGAVALALIFGKPIGIFLFSVLAVKVGVSVKPSYSWKILWGGGMLAGIGFTMALFVASLAFDVGDRQDSAKLGILMGSFCAAIFGTIYMSIVSKTGETKSE
ncbi:Na+/H+ antiporter NhaA [uncultured Fibrobacter sp.]|uniref:Na+/H+ antiporter NhaA n=1 Tax=uncultured Fibrobacter sp. TaxID=261512 RepID=UPI0025FE8C09|nr:Na+/H+ antiporter NhaA [uncultured Fibrobacter sp.]